MVSFIQDLTEAHILIFIILSYYDESSLKTLEYTIDVIQ